MKSKIILLFCLMLFLIGCSTSNTQSKNGKEDFNKDINRISSYQGKVGIVTKDTVLKKPYYITVDENNKHAYEEINFEYKIEKNDVVLFIEEENEYYRVTLAHGETPRPIGYIAKDILSFDTNLFKNANQGQINEAMSYESKNGKEMGLRSGIGIVKKREDDWVLFELPGGEDSFWIKSESINFDFNTEIIDLSSEVGN